MTRINLEVGAALSGGITHPGRVMYATVVNGIQPRVRFLAPSLLNDDPNAIWGHFDYAFDTAGYITWTVVPPSGINTSFVLNRSDGSDAYFPVPDYGLYKIKAVIVDNNGTRAESYTQVAAITSSNQTAPAYDTTWGVAVVTDPGTGGGTGGSTGGSGGSGGTTTPVIIPPSTGSTTVVARNYSSLAQEMTLPASLNAVATQVALDSVSGLPSSVPYTLLLDYGQVNEEIVTVTQQSGNVLTIKRGEDGTSAVAHSAGAKVRHGITARDLAEPQKHMASTSGVHGVQGNVVGTTDTQTLSGKTIDGSVNILKNIPASALGNDVVATSAAQTLTNKTLDGTQNTFRNIPSSAITGGSASVTPDGVAILTNKSLDGRFNTISHIPYSAIDGTPTSTTASTARYWYLNGYAWVQRTNETSTDDFVLFQTNLGYVDKGFVTVTSNCAVDVVASCRVEWYVDGGTQFLRRSTSIWDQRFSTKTQATGVTLTTASTFAHPGGTLLLRGILNKNGGDGNYSTVSTTSRCEIFWVGGPGVDVSETGAVNTAYAGQIA